MKKTLWARWFVAVLLAGGLTACSPREVQVGSSLQVDPAVSLAKDGYELQVSADGITVKGTTEAGHKTYLFIEEGGVY